MSVLFLFLAAFFLGLGACHAFLKVGVARDHCAGGAPLLDGCLFPPLFLGLGAELAFRWWGLPLSGWMLGGAALLLLPLLYGLAWRRGSAELRKTKTGTL